MRPSASIAIALVLSAGPLRAQSALRVAPCSVAPIVVDSAREEVLSVLTSGSPVVEEIRQEQRIATNGDLSRVTVVRDSRVCERLSAVFARGLARGTTFVVLRVGPLYYAREPDQTRGTGVLTDSTFQVVARFGRAIP